MPARHLKHAGHLALWAFYRDLNPFIQQSLSQFTEILIHLTDCKLQLVPYVYFDVEMICKIFKKIFGVKTFFSESG